MSKSKILTYIPFGKMFENMPQHIDFKISQSGQNFLDNNFTKCTEELSDLYMHYKDGIPEDVNDWAKQFDLDLKLSGDYAIATILNIAMTWKNEAQANKIIYNDVFYNSGWHDFAFDTNKEGLYQIPVEDHTIGLFISTKPFELDSLNEIIYSTEEINLNLPLVKLKIEEDLTQHFKGSKAYIDNQAYYCENAKSLTELNVTLKGAEVKQAATLTLRTTCVMPQKRNVLIDKPFYLYVKVKDSLIFAAYVDVDGWIKK